MDTELSRHVQDDKVMKEAIAGSVIFSIMLLGLVY